LVGELSQLRYATLKGTCGYLMHTEEESDATESPEKREDEAKPKQPLAGWDPVGPFIDLGYLFLVDGVAIHSERPLLMGCTGSVRGSRVMGANSRGGTSSSNDDTVEWASTREASWNRESMSTRGIQGWRLVGCISLGFDQRRQVVEPESTLSSRRAEVHVFEIDDASVV
jgi:hypothetical protein